MKISNEFTVHTPIDRAWRVLTDLEGIAPCLPGAQLTGVDGDVYQGKVKVKVGPVVSEFAGTAKFAEKDDNAYRGVIDAKGRDARSAGNASALITASLQPDGDSTKVSVDTDLKISGKLAQFGSGMIKEVSGKLLAQFVTNLEAKLAAEDNGLTTPDEDTAAAGSGEAGSAAPGSAAPGSGAVGGGKVNGTPADVAASAAAVGTAAGAGVAAAPVEPSPVGGDPVAVTPDLPATAPAAPGEEAAGGAGVVDAGSAASTLAAPDKGAGAPGSAGIAAVAPAVAVAPASAAVVAPRAAAPATAQAEEPEPLDLLDLAGGSIYKRLVPAAVGVAVVGAVIAWFVSRR